MWLLDEKLIPDSCTASFSLTKSTTISRYDVSVASVLVVLLVYLLYKLYEDLTGQKLKLIINLKQSERQYLFGRIEKNIFINTDILYLEENRYYLRKEVDPTVGIESEMEVRYN